MHVSSFILLFVLGSWTLQLWRWKRTSSTHLPNLKRSWPGLLRTPLSRLLHLMCTYFICAKKNSKQVFFSGLGPLSGYHWTLCWNENSLHKVAEGGFPAHTAAPRQLWRTEGGEWWREVIKQPCLKSSISCLLLLGLPGKQLLIILRHPRSRKWAH